MQIIRKEMVEGELTVELEGVLDGGIDLLRQIGTPPPRMSISCRKVTHVNSSLVKPWLEYFQLAAARGSQVRFLACPSSILDYFNMIRNFRCGGRVESVIAPFFCKRCRAEVRIEIATPDYDRAIAAVEGQACPGCRGPVVFDDETEIFFRFLTFV